MHILYTRSYHIREARWSGYYVPPSIFHSIKTHFVITLITILSVDSDTFVPVYTCVNDFKNEYNMVVTGRLIEIDFKITINAFF